MDKEVRNRIQKATQQARSLLEEEYRTQLEGTYDILPDGTIKDAPGAHLGEQEKVVRHKLVQAVEHKRSNGMGPAESVDAFIREAAFTTLNRYVALKMLEARDLLQECVSKSDNSSGFKEFIGLAPGLKELPDHGYRLYIECLFDELSQEIKVLFDRRDPVSLLWPRRQALHELLEIINREELSSIWAEDETIGWVYQYFNSKEEREVMRDASQAPRNSRELAVRNQFFTPRYVVEFLTDNTLGRIWYEMRKGDTALNDECRYLVRRPNEVFLDAGEKAPSVAEGWSDLSQGELLNNPVYIEHRPKKDPRGFRILDPACGSGHFLLYTFDLLERIYEEAWDDPKSPKFDATSRTLKEDFETLEDLRLAIPKLVMEHNLHGIDIDPRAVQIAALAMWLRAQKAWKNIGIKAAERPRMAKSNIVTAEPMPGEESMKEEFTAGLKPLVLGQLVDTVFDKMKLAGEAGSLLKIEEEIKDVVSKAKEEYRKELRLRKEEAGYLPGMAPERASTLFDFADMSDEDFLDQSEDAILAALKEYAERAENGHTVRRRLFADDAARGFSFIDLCRRHYDVVLMNPPFGEANQRTVDLINRSFPDWNSNLLCAFISRAGALSSLGYTGVVYDRTANIKNTYEAFRKRYFLNTRSSLKAIVDLGWEVLDSNVEVSAGIISNDLTTTPALTWGCDLTKVEKTEKGVSLQSAIPPCKSSLAKTVLNQALSSLPNSVIGYYFDDFLIRIFKVFPSLEESQIKVFNGHTIKSDEYFRYWWEPECSRLKGKYPDWARLYNGGSYSRYYSPETDVVYYGKEGSLIQNHPSTIFRNLKLQQQAGIAFGKRGEFIDAHILREGFVSTVEGQACSVDSIDNVFIGLAVLNSIVFQYGINAYCGQHKYPGYVNLFPIPHTSDSHIRTAAAKCRELVEAKRTCSMYDETAPVFVSAFGNSNGIADFVSHISKYVSLITTLHHEINEECYRAYKLSASEIQIIKRYGKSEPEDRFWDDEPGLPNDQVVAQRLVSYLIGSIYGRWDVRIAMDLSFAPNLPDPFGPLPVCPPGMLIGPDGLPAEPDGIVSEKWLRARPDVNTLTPEGTVSKPTIPDSEYPLRIAWNGILVDDPGFNGTQPHRDDVVRRVRAVLDLLWKDKAHEIEQEACDILDVSDLREYFRKPAKFFQDHIKRYSKSRRKAPIYWQLATPSASYSIWLYYHRFDRDTFYKVLEYIKDKLKHEEWNLESLRQEFGSNPNAGQRKQIEDQEFFVQEMRDFRDEVARITPLWNPNLNDGVIINFAPLWRLVAHYKPWQKECKKVWDKLVNGDYDWAHLAMHLWPERVVPKCQKDCSLAIAHGLEDTFWYEDNKGKMQPREVSQEEVDNLVKERTSAAVKSALQSLLDAPEMATSGKKRKKKR